MSGSPETSDLMPLIRAASLLIALSKASGPSSRPPLICPRAAHLAQRGGVESRHLELILDRRQDCDLRRLNRATWPGLWRSGRCDLCPLQGRGDAIAASVTMSTLVVRAHPSGTRG